MSLKLCICIIIQISASHLKCLGPCEATLALHILVVFVPRSTCRLLTPNTSYAIIFSEINNREGDSMRRKSSLLARETSARLL